ncbi:MAG TPA: hypothetical protein VG206_04545 [Terriglobia bacterium]|nr:hypothetical protein [Terriglobia bacterium]
MRRTSPAVRHLRPERHNLQSIATLRIVIARYLLRQLPYYPFCGARRVILRIDFDALDASLRLRVIRCAMPSVVEQLHAGEFLQGQAAPIGRRVLRLQPAYTLAAILMAENPTLAASIPTQFCGGKAGAGSRRRRQRLIASPPPPHTRVRESPPTFDSQPYPHPLKSTATFSSGDHGRGAGEAPTPAITKRGKPVAKLVPADDLFNFMAGELTIAGDILSPVVGAQKWERLR